MTKDEMINAVKGLNPNTTKGKDTLYAIARELGLNLRRSNCGKCVRDHFHIVMEELGIIKSAASQSKF